MRKWIALLLGGLLAAGLAGCGPSGQAKVIWTVDHVQGFVDGGAFSEELEELDADTLWSLYRLEEAGLDREQLDSGKGLRSSGATCEEVAVLCFADIDSAAAAKEAVEAYVQGRIESNREYRPAEIPKLESAVVEQRGSAVLLLVAADLEAVKELLD